MNVNDLNKVGYLLPLNTDALIDAGRTLFESELMDVLENRGFDSSDRGNADYPDDTILIIAMTRYCGKAEQVWGLPVWMMFDKMEIPKNRHGDALYRMFMSCRGHGISLDDGEFGDVKDAIKRNFSSLGKTVDHRFFSPFHTEFSELYEMAQFEVDRLAREIDEEDTTFKPDAQVKLVDCTVNGEYYNGPATVIGMKDGRVVVETQEGNDRPGEIIRVEVGDVKRVRKVKVK